MATLELSVSEDVIVAPVQRTRRLGPLFWTAIGWMIFVFAVAILAPVLPLPSPTDMDMLERRAPISALHWLGTDGLGRDELSRLVYGAILALAVTAYLGQSIFNLTCILGVLGIPAFMRVARASTLTLARREFVIAAQALGASHARILLRELLPNVALPLVAFFLLGVAVTIVVEGALSFLGLGVPPPISSWGSMIGEGRESLEIAPQLAFIPAIAMFLTVLSFNLVGDTLRALTDPRQGAL